RALRGRKQRRGRPGRTRNPLLRGDVMRGQPDGTSRSVLANPGAWLVLLLPLATIGAGIWTLWLAVGPGATDASPDEGRRMAQVQGAALDAGEGAARAGVAARLHQVHHGL